MTFKELRISKGFANQTLLAKLINVNRATVSMWEIGLSRPKLESVIKIANIFGVTIDEVADCFYE